MDCFLKIIRSTMIDRFLGSDGHSRLINVLKECNLFSSTPNIIPEISKTGLLTEFNDGESIIEQNDSDNDIYFIISGKVEIFVNDRLVAERKAPNYIGEMSLVNPKETRSATVKAKGKVVLLRVKENVFVEFANVNPMLWRNVVVEIADRLKQRERFFKPKNLKPKLFVGCSVEDIEVARAVQFNLSHDIIETEIWTDNIFSPSGFTINDLFSKLKHSDFSIFVISGNDIVESRNKKLLAPRDNVIFEIGLFMGKLTNNRVMIIKPKGKTLKIPSDLLGLRLLEYDSSIENLSSTLGPACFEVRAVINKEGAF